MGGRGPVRAASAMAVALGVNLALLAGLAWLNRPAEPSAQAEPIMTVSLRSAASPRSRSPAPRPDEAQPQRQPPRPAPPLPAPTPQVQRVRPVEIDLAIEMPRMSPVRVAVRQPAETADPPKTVASPPSPPEPAAEPTPPRRPSPPAPPAPMAMNEADRPPREKPGNPQPSYPAAALRRGIEGRVTVRLLIDADGRVQRAQVVDVDGHQEFGDAVLNVVRRWRFEPAVHEGRHVPVFGVKEIRFELRS